MDAEKAINLLSEVFPDCEVFESAEDVLKAGYPNDGKFYRHKVTDYIVAYSAKAELQHDIQPLYSSYHGRLRVVDESVCQHHLETFDPHCWENCETEWAVNRLRSAPSAAYKQHRDYLAQKAQSSLTDGVSKNLWGN